MSVGNAVKSFLHLFLTEVKEGTNITTTMSTVQKISTTSLPPKEVKVIASSRYANNILQCYEILPQGKICVPFSNDIMFNYSSGLEVTYMYIVPV